MVHVNNVILLSHKTEWNNTICTDMDGPKDCHTEWSMSDTEIQMSYDITYIWNLEKGTNGLIYQTEVESQM